MKIFGGKLGHLLCSMDRWMLEVDGSILMSHLILFVMVKFEIVISPNPFLLSISSRYFSRKNEWKQIRPNIKYTLMFWNLFHVRTWRTICIRLYLLHIQCERPKVSVGWNEMVLNPRVVSSMMDIDTIKLQHTLCKSKVQTWEHLIAKIYGHWLTIEALVKFSEIMMGWNNHKFVRNEFL